MPTRRRAISTTSYIIFIFLCFGIMTSDAFATMSTTTTASTTTTTVTAAHAAAKSTDDDDTTTTAAASGHCSSNSINNNINDLMTKSEMMNSATSRRAIIGAAVANDDDIDDDDVTATAAAAAVAAATAAAAAAVEQKQRRRMYIAQLIIHFQSALEELGVAVDNNSNNSDGIDDEYISRRSHSNNYNDNDDSDDDNRRSHSNGNDNDVMHRIESMSILIHESMSISSRNYHSVQHALDVVNGLNENDDNDNGHGLNDPIAILAALFHDCIYYHVDGGLSELQLKKLKGAVVCLNQDDHDDDSNNNNNKAAATAATHIITYQASCEQHYDDDLLCMVEYIFGYEHCQSLTHATGLNEFLSAMIAVRELEPLLSKKQLAQIACCIEMTIPFRPNIIVTTTTTTLVDHNNNDDDTTTTTTTTITPADRLYANMVRVNDKFDLNMTDNEIIQSVQRACILAHSDLANFGSTDVEFFLDNTWSLLPESNEALRQQYLYTVQQFQLAVYKMNNFFNFLSPNVIFPSFHDIPSRHVMETKYDNAKRNLQVGRRYVSAKLLSISILSAIAELTGGDAPISLFMGDLPSRHATSAGAGTSSGGASPKSSKRRLGDGLGLPPVDILLHSDHHRRQTNDDDAGGNHHNCHDNESGDGVPFIDADVYNLLAFGRRSETDFDIRQSPLAAYLYGSLGNVGLDNVLNNTSTILWPMSESAAWNLLQKLPLETVLTPIAENMCQVAVSRCDEIRKMLRTLQQRQEHQQQQQQQEQHSDKK